jgi:hypothetical protein
VRRRLADSKPRAVTAYNKFMAAEVPAVKLTLTALAGRARERAAFAKAAAGWQTSSLNPKNSQAATAEGAAGGAVGGAEDGGACAAHSPTGDAAEGLDAGDVEQGEEVFEDAYEHAVGGDDLVRDAEDVVEAREGEGMEVDAGALPADAPAPRQQRRARRADPDGTPNEGGPRKRR